MKRIAMKGMAMKRIVYMILVLVLFLPTNTISFASVSDNLSNSNGDNRTIGDIEEKVHKYIRTKYPNMVIGSSEYVDYLCEQLLFESDKEATKLDNYDDFCFYASYYLGSANNPFKTEEVKIDGKETILRFKDSAKSKLVSDIKRMLKERDERAEQSINEEDKVNPSVSLYSVSDAVSYAQAHAHKYNKPKYRSFRADCTNFVSQCIHAGGKNMHYPSNYQDMKINKTTEYWYHLSWDWRPLIKYGVSSSFIGVDDFFTYWKGRCEKVIYGLTINDLQNAAKKGDIVQFYQDGDDWFHSIIITSGSKGNWKYCGHSNNRKDYDVSEIRGITKFRILRF